VISPFTNLSTPSSIQLRQNAFTEITGILNNTAKTFNTTCEQCMASLIVLQNLTFAVPWEVPPLLIEICNFVHFDGNLQV
jgi:sphingomyelin phosphodiesterase